MIASAQTLRRWKPVDPFCERSVFNGMSYGVSYAGYDIRIAEKVELTGYGATNTYVPFRQPFKLASSVERFKMPTNAVGIVHDKSTWARRGLSVFNTVIEPGWEGYLTLELVNNGPEFLYIEAGSPIAQVIFHITDHDTEGYVGKYNNQEQGPQEARFE